MFLDVISCSSRCYQKYTRLSVFRRGPEPKLFAHNFYYVILANIFRFRFYCIPQLQQSLFIIGSIRIYSGFSLICRQTKVLIVRVTNCLRS